MKLTLWLVFALSIVGVGAQPLLADHGNGHGKKHADNDEQSWQQRDGYDYRVYGPGQGRPPGWSHGKKTGWGNCGMPPGQAKKYGCQAYTYQGRPYYYYQDDVGRTIVRRPTVELHGSIDVVH